MYELKSTFMCCHLSISLGLNKYSQLINNKSFNYLFVYVNAIRLKYIRYSNKLSK